ncbi:DsbA family protein, partial [Candidatus Pacebacteria bacterium]|nr:DsbA family protein [Candidatus Paceibacterota bacterium]
ENDGNNAVKENVDLDVNTGAENVIPVNEDDHLYGSVDAKVTIIEFSDFECPFCGRVHPTLKQIVDEYDGDVAWVYRHFPLSQIHPNAEPLAQASECVSEFGGNDAFWNFADGVFDGRINLSDLSGINKVTGVNKNAVQTCVDSGKYKAEVQKDLADGIATGGRGTPHSVVVGPNGSTFALSGAQPIEAFRQVIDQMLAQ